MKRGNYFRAVLATAVLFAVALISFLPKSLANTPKNAGTKDTNAGNQHLAEAYGKLPLSFEANTGQTSEQVKFVSRGSGYTLFLTRNAEAVLVLRGSTKRAPEASPQSVFRMKLADTKATPQAEGLNRLQGKANYFIGNDPKKWRTNVPTYSKVDFHGVYPGVDLAYYGNQQQLEYDFLVAPHADTSSITMAVEGARMSVDHQGNLVLKAKDGEIAFQKPVAYQIVNGDRLEIPSRYLLKGEHRVGFELAAYDRNRPLVIDPVLSYSTYLGGSNYGYGIAVDSAGSTYLTGVAGTTNFPTTPGAFQTTARNTTHASVFVTKLNPAGSALVYSTYLDGSANPSPYAGDDRGAGIAVDAAGNAYVTGWTFSLDFPTTPGAFQSANRGLQNAFVTKLNSDGTALLYSTYLGGSGSGPNGGDRGAGIAVDTQGNAYVTGRTCSSNFPVTPLAYQSSYKGNSGPGFGGGMPNCNAFLSELNPGLLGPLSLVYSTYIGGSGNSLGDGDSGNGIALDSTGNVYMAGFTGSSDFPTTPGAFQMSLKAPREFNAFVSKFSPGLLGQLSLVYSTYLGGSTYGDKASAIAVDSQGSAYVTGFTASADFPVTPLAFQTSFHLYVDAFVSKLDPSGSSLVYSTFLSGTTSALFPGTTSDYPYGIAVDATGKAYVTGLATSTDFPTTPDALQPQPATSSSRPGFVTVLNPDGSALAYSTYLGGSSSDAGLGIAVDNSGNAYVTGVTRSTDFPTTPGAFQTTFQGFNDAFIAKFSGFATAP